MRYGEVILLNLLGKYNFFREHKIDQAIVISSLILRGQFGLCV
jgi:hypothetical protein